MRADRGRRSERGLTAQGVCLVVLAVGVGLPAALVAGVSAPLARSTTAALGSSCTNPYVLSVGYGSAPPIIIDTNKAGVIGLMGSFPPGESALDVWYVKRGYVVCSARIQRSDGSVVPPTYIFPYSTPAPIGGQYNVTADPATHYDSITITAAKSTVPPGTNCNYPQESDIVETVAHTGPRPAVAIKLVGLPSSTPTGSTVTFRLKVTPLKPHVVLCPKADINIWIEDAQGHLPQRANYYVSIGAHGGLSSSITVPASYYRPGEATDPQLIDAAVYSQVVKAKSHHR